VISPVVFRAAVCQAPISPFLQISGKHLKSEDQQHRQQAQEAGAGEGNADAAIHNRLNAAQQQGIVIRASMRGRDDMHSRIRQSPLLTKIANMGVKVSHHGHGRSKTMAGVDPVTGLYLNQQKPSLNQAVKRSQTLSKTDIPLAVRPSATDVS